MKLKIDIHIHHDNKPDVAASLVALTDLLSRLRSKLNNALAGAPAESADSNPSSEDRSMDPISQALADLTAEVHAQETVIDSAITYIAGVPNLIQQAVNEAINAGALPQNLTAITNLISEMKTETTKLSDALVANTTPPLEPPAPTPTPDVPPTPNPDVPPVDPNNP